MVYHEHVGHKGSFAVAIGVGMILKLGGLNHGEHVRSDTLSIISHFKDYVYTNNHNKESC